MLTQICVRTVKVTSDLYQLRLCVLECSSFIWRQGGNQAASHTSTGQTCPGLEQHNISIYYSEQLLTDYCSLAYFRLVTQSKFLHSCLPETLNKNQETKLSLMFLKNKRAVKHRNTRGV